jgi:lysylphosphatidylglycerol synthetase-like protein (DUF2156 family)
LRLQTLYGYNAHSLVSIAPGASAWTMPGIDGAIIYNEFNRVWLAAGDPLARPEDVTALARGFVAAAHQAGRLAAFVPATHRFAHEATTLGLSAIKIGAAPYIDLTTWESRGNRGKKIRAGVNQARRAGVRVEVVQDLDDKLKTEAADLCLSWLKSRRTATSFGWLLALDPFLRAERKRLFIARDKQDRLVGLLAASPIPTRNGWYLEDVVRQPDAPRGTAELLIFYALGEFQSLGASLATLGTAPLAKDGDDDLSTRDHPLLERALLSTAMRLSRFYNFDGLRRFKAKFVPSWWESEYALVQHGAMVPTKVAHALLQAVVPGGVPQLLTRKALQSISPQRSHSRISSIESAPF